MWPGWVRTWVVALGGGDGQLWLSGGEAFRWALGPKGLICPVTPTPIPGGGPAGEKSYLLLWLVGK